jgi:FKBP-type peptidyl-prolyl cis-trans isomerase FkpA
MSVTTVPIRPIKKGSLAKYWIGIALVLAVAGALAWLGTKDIYQKFQTNAQFLEGNSGQAGVTSTKTGVQIKVEKAGEGKSPTDDDVTLVAYKGMLRDGTVFKQEDQAPIPVAGIFPGLSEALKKMQKGGKYKVWIPSDLAYGPKDQTDPQTGKVMMPGNSLLIFEIEMIDFMSRALFEERMAAMQKAQAEQAKRGGAGGAPGGGTQNLPPEIQAQIQQQMQQQMQGQVQ